MISFKWIIRYLLVASSGLVASFYISAHFVPVTHSDDHLSNINPNEGSMGGVNSSTNLNSNAVSVPNPSPNSNIDSIEMTGSNPSSSLIPSRSPNSNSNSNSNSNFNSNVKSDVSENSQKTKIETNQKVDHQESLSVESKDSIFIENFKYDPTVGRDPFQPYRVLKIAPSSADVKVKRLGSQPLEPLQLVDLDKLSLVGIIWDTKTPRAMLVNKALDNKAYIIQQNSRVGRNNGIVKVIREGEVIIVESELIEGNTIYTTKVLELSR